MKDVTSMSDVVGATTFWKIPNVTLRYETLIIAWNNAGLPTEWLFKPPRDSKAMRRAMSDHKERRRLLRPLKRGSSWALVQEHIAGEKDLAHEVTLSVALSKPDKESEAVLQIEGDPELRRSVEQKFIEHKGTVTAHDLSELLIDCVERLHGLALRDGGGVYFIPPTQLETWRQIADVVESVTRQPNGVAAQVYELRAKTDARSFRAVLDGIVSEAKVAIETMRGELAESEQLEAQGAKGLGVRALTNRASAIEELQAKVQEYETLLGQALPDTHGAISRLRVAVFEARSLAEAKAEAEAAGGTLKLVG